MCRLLGIKRRLSRAYHPETDGSTERMNATIEAYLRFFRQLHPRQLGCPLPGRDAGDQVLVGAGIGIGIVFSSLISGVSRNPSVRGQLFQYAILGFALSEATGLFCYSASTGVSPFFLDHGYHLEPLDIADQSNPAPAPTPASERAKAIVRKLQDALDLAHSAIAAAQQTQEEHANRRRDPAVSYQVGDKAWLDLRNIRTDRPSKKLDARYMKYTVEAKVGSHAYRLNTPQGIHPVFHTSLLRPAHADPLPSQTQTDWQPPAILVNGEEEFHVEEILDERRIRWGRGHRHQYLVKWTGYQGPTWTAAQNLADNAALDAWEARRTHSVQGFNPLTKQASSWCPDLGSVYVGPANPFRC
ncbi:hypothetical protein V1521DRAFT_441577 [Lipomyces starkeyi]